MSYLDRKGLLAVTAVIDMALNAHANRPISASVLARHHGLPRRHLEPLLRALVRHRILRPSRGSRGGYELARDPRGISIEDIVRAVAAVDEVGDSRLVNEVVLPLLAPAERAFYAALRRISVSELARFAKTFGDKAGPAHVQGLWTVEITPANVVKLTPQVGRGRSTAQRSRSQSLRRSPRPA